TQSPTMDDADSPDRTVHSLHTDTRRYADTTNEEAITMTSTAQLPKWLKPFNCVIMALQPFGLAIATMRVLAVPGRKSGRLRSTPVSPLTVDGQRYIIGGLAEADWVKNARAAGWGILAHGRRQEQVALIELPVEQRGPILRAFPSEVPHG